MSGKGKKRSIVYLVIAAVIILILLCLPFVVSAQSIQSGASLGVQQVQSFNRVQFHVEWVTDEPAETAIWHFQFGDGTETVLSGVSGSASFSHDYAYSVGGLTTYHPSIDLGNWVDVWTGEIVVDDRPVEETYTVYLPIIMNAGQNPSCSITVSSQNANHVVFDTTWSEAGDGSHSVSFGDGTHTEQFSGPSGSGQTWHDYAYPGGNFIITMELSGGGSCFTKVLVGWP